MEVITQQTLEIGELNQVGEARRIASRLARLADLSEEDVGRVAIAATEAGTNLVKHGGGGQLLLECVRDGTERGVGMIALDRGPGIPDVAASMIDGFSTRGTVGSGLGAIRRQSSVFDLYTGRGQGTAVFSRIYSAGAKQAKGGLVVGAVCVPYPGETACGDTWTVERQQGRTLVMVADGLGHGIEANEASERAREIFHRGTELSLPDLMERLHAGLRPTRGAAIGIAQVDPGAGLVRFCGVGNIAGRVITGSESKAMVSHHGTVGHDMRKVREFEYSWSHDSILVMHSDGLTSHWGLDVYAGLPTRHPALVAGVLFRDFKRERDDITVVVAREAA